MGRRAPTTAGCRSTPPRCASSTAGLAAAQIIEACARHGIRAISPWRDQVAAAGLDGHGARRCSDAGLELSGFCRGGMFPAADAAGRQRRARRQPPRASTRPRRSARACLVLVVGGLPGALAGRPAHKDIAGAREQVRDGIAATAGRCPRAPACRWRSSRCTRCTPPTAPASTRSRRRSTSATSSTRRAAARSASRSTSTTSGGTRTSHAQIARAGARAPAGLPRLRLAGADPRPARSTAA